MRRTRYPVKLGDKLYPAHTEVKPATLEEMRHVWPGIEIREGSSQVGVWFPNVSVPTIIHVGHLEDL